MSGKITYIAKEKLASGHVVDTSYDLTFDMEVLDENTDFIKTVNVSLDGSEETSHLRDDEIFDIKASFIPKTDLELWKEFLFSTKLGQSFTFFPDGVTSYTVTNQTKSYRPIRFGTTDDDFAFTLKFKVEV